MCSIAGFYNSSRDFNTEQERYSYILNDMNKALAHRGPDAQNTVLSSHCGLAHTRLSIRDVARGEQPMKKVIGENTIYCCLPSFSSESKIEDTADIMFL